MFIYTTKDAVKYGYSGYITEGELIERFLIKLLDYQGYKNILREVMISNEHKSSMRADIVAEKDKKIVLEVEQLTAVPVIFLFPFDPVPVPKDGLYSPLQSKYPAFLFC